MLRRSTTLVPVLRSCRCGGAVCQPVLSQTRNISDITRFLQPRNIVRDIFREMDRMERDFERCFPPGYVFQRAIPIEGQDTRNHMYRVNIDVAGYKPEDIKISMKDGVMKIEASMDRTSENGTSLKQSFVRQFIVPDTVDQSTLKSFIDDGILRIEAELNKESEGPKAIPIEGIQQKSKM